MQKSLNLLTFTVSLNLLHMVKFLSMIEIMDK